MKYTFVSLLILVGCTSQPTVYDPTYQFKTGKEVGIPGGCQDLLKRDKEANC